MYVQGFVACKHDWFISPGSDFTLRFSNDSCPTRAVSSTCVLAQMHLALSSYVSETGCVPSQDCKW